MAKLKYNLDEIKDFNVTPGRYKAKLIKVEQSLSSQKKPMLTWRWKILTGSEKGKEVLSWTTLVPTALMSLKQHLTAFGLKGKINSDTNRLIGKVVVLVIAVQPSNKPGKEGTLYSTVAAVYPKNTSLDEDVPPVEEDEDEEETDEDEDEVDEDEEEDVSEDEDEDESDEDESEDEDEVDEEDEEEDVPEPPRKKKPVAKKPVKSKVTVSKKSKGRIPF